MPKKLFLVGDICDKRAILIILIYQHFFILQLGEKKGLYFLFKCVIILSVTELHRRQKSDF